MSDIPTPRTDAFEDLGFHEQPINWCDFARKLERELAAKDTEKYCFSSCAFFAAQQEDSK